MVVQVVVLAVAAQVVAPGVLVPLASHAGHKGSAHDLREQPLSPGASLTFLWM